MGLICFGPFKSWSSLVGAVTGATAIMYGFAPVALGALRTQDPDRPRAYRMPMPKLLLPLAFASANLIFYSGGYTYQWKIDLAIVVGLLFHAVGGMRRGTLRAEMLRHGYWIVPWLGGATLIGAYGEYGGVDPVFHRWFLGEWTDIVVVVVVLSLVVYYRPLMIVMSPEQVQQAVSADAHHIESGDVLNVPIS